MLPVSGVRVSVTFHLMFIYITFSSVCVAVWPPFGKELPIRLAMCSNCILSICNFIFSRFVLKGGVWFLIAPVPVHCLIVTFKKDQINSNRVKVETLIL